jgi:hypothetical protein
MTQLDILIPFGLPPAELAKELLSELSTPALATLIARARNSRRKTFDDFSPALPHETWIAGQFGLDCDAPAATSPAVARSLMKHFGLGAGDGVWLVLQPVHIRIGTDRLVLTDLRKLTLSEHESRALFEAIRPLFEEEGKSLLYGDTHTWFVRADEWHSLQTSTPDAACEQHIDDWMPKGVGEREWRKLQNEVQMHWYAHPVNEEREARNLNPVNSLWLWGGAAANVRATSQPERTAFNLQGWMRGFGQPAANSSPARKLSDIIGASPKHGLLVHDALIPTALASDWSSWLDQIHQLEQDLFAPLRAAIQCGSIATVSLVMTSETALSEFSVSRNSLRKFWAKPALTKLLP